MTSRASLQAVLASRLGSADEARWMIEEVLGAGARTRTGTGPEAEQVLFEMAARRLGGEPLQYVLGSWAFRSIELAVDPRALIPRPETEQVVEVALGEVRRRLLPAGSFGGPLRVADLGTGSGAIALSVAVELGSECPGLQVAATDVDPSALELAAANLRRVAADHPYVEEQVELRAGGWFDALAPAWHGLVGLVVSNPPYVSEPEWPSLDPQVRREPYGALVAPAGSDGTPGFAGVEAVVKGARDWLAPGGAVVVEMAPHHAQPARAAAKKAGYREVRVEADLAGRPRALVARR
ncbi:MAG: peptide chain release factor N(5)-glutamine methyltransferase [Actinomycetota bacterium]|nr:peptide chain release factor N(5)-glutamine methyltransferase [Actinomycetota bacterium]